MNINTEIGSYVRKIDGAKVSVRDKTIVYKYDDDGEYINEVSRTYNVRNLSPDSDISGEPQEVQDVCNAVWTDEVKAAWAEKQLADNPPAEEESEEPEASDE